MSDDYEADEYKFYEQHLADLKVAKGALEHAVSRMQEAIRAFDLKSLNMGSREELKAWHDAMHDLEWKLRCFDPETIQE